MDSEQWIKYAKAAMSESTEKKPNYCQKENLMSECTIPKHKKADPKIIFEKCLYFQPRSKTTSICMYYRNGKKWNHHCDCMEAQYDK